jgi:hypothetical protein
MYYWPWKSILPQDLLDEGYGTKIVLSDNNASENDCRDTLTKVYFSSDLFSPWFVQL